VPTVSPFGPFVNKNHFAGYVVMGAVLSLGVALGALDRSRGRRRAGLDTESADHTAVLFLASFLACALAACVSLSRGGVVGLAAGIATLLLLRWRAQAERPRHVLLLGLLSVFLVGVGMFAVIPSVARERLQSLGRVGTDISARYRVDVWRDTLRMSVSSPLWGQGLGAYAAAFPRYKSGHGELYVEHAENEYLEVLAEGGVLGLGLLGVGLFRLGRSGVATLHDHESRLVRGIVTGALAGMAALLAQNLTDFNFRMPSSLFLFAFLGAVVASQGPFATVALSARVKVLAAAALLSLSAISVALEEPDAGLARRSVLAMAKGPVIPVRLARARTLVEQELQRMPLEAELWLLLSWTRLVSGRQDEARELAAHSERLDPTNPAIRSEVRRLRTAMDGPR
jgi:O-antigen ligase